MSSLRCFRAAVATYSCLSSTGTQTAAQLGHGLAAVAASSASRKQLTSSKLHWHPGSGICKASLPNPTAAAAVPGATHAGFVTDAAARSSSAAASAAAAYNEELQALQGAGLSRATAAAVHKAWSSGRFDRFDGDTLALHRLRISPQPSPHSQMRLLADIRHVLAAHKAAAAAAAEAAAAGQRSPVQPPQRADVETPKASAAQGVQGAGQQGRLGWGDMDMQRVLMQEPGLILVPVDDLARRFDTLLNGLCTLLDRDHALQYVYKHRHMHRLLADPEAAVEDLRQRCDAYAEVLGVPPPATLLAASESSHIANLTPSAFRRKLQHFEERWGAEIAHATLKDQPHLLASKVTSVDRNSEGLQQLLGCSEQQLHRLVRKGSRVLSTDTTRISRNLAELAALLKPLGFSTEDVKRVVLKQPSLLLANPVTVSSKLEALKELLGPSAHRLPYAVRHAPSLLGWNPDTLASRVDGLQQNLNCSRDRVCAMLGSCPAIIEADLGTIGSKLQQLTAVLGLSLTDVQDMCSREPSILLLRPELIDSKLTAWAEVLRTPKSAIAEALYSYPGLARFDAQAVSAHMLALQALVQRSTLWSAACFKSSTKPSKSAPSTGVTVFDRDAYWQFANAALPALRQELPDLQYLDAKAAVEEVWKQYKCWRKQQDIQLRLMPHAACKPPAFGQFVSTELPQHKAAHPNASHNEALRAVQQQYKQLRQRGHEQQLIALQQLEIQPAAVQHSGKPCPWPLAYSRNPSGRLLLRLEFLLATGLQEQVSLHLAMTMCDANWSIAHPGFGGWVQLRLQHLQQDPSEWSAVLLRKALKRNAEQGTNKRGQSAASGTAAAAKVPQQSWMSRAVVPSDGSRDQAGADTKAVATPSGDQGKGSRRRRI